MTGVGLLILVDDLGYGDLSVAPFTGHGTNNLERMARESTAMSKFPRCCFDLYSEPCVDSDWFVSFGVWASTVSTERALKQTSTWQ